MKITSVFEQLLENPTWYLTNNSILSLWSYLQGYMAALDETKCNYDFSELDHFFKWIPRRFEIENSLSWADVVFFVSGHDDLRSIELVRELWIEYRNMTD